MNTKIKLSLILLLTILSTACTSTKLNRGLVHQEKISLINVKQLDENITHTSSRTWTAVGGVIFIPLAAVGAGVDAKVNAKRKIALAEAQSNITDFDVNKVIKAALEHNAEGRAFASDVTIGSDNINESYLVPVLTPNIVMSSGYSFVKVSLKVATGQKKINNEEKRNTHKETYYSKQTLDGNVLSAEENRQYWIDNPLVLKEKIVNAFYDVAKQFADDFNSNPISEK